LQPFRNNPHHFNYRRYTLKKTTRAIALFAVAAATAPAYAIDMNANMEFDNLLENQKRGVSQGGRVEFNVSGKGGPGYFVAGRASFLAKKDGNAGIDDMWVQGGNATADVKLGRFEAADLFPLPRDAYVPYAGFAPYRTNVLRGRFGNQDTSTPNGIVNRGVFHAAGTLNVGGGVSVELGIVEAQKSTNSAKGFRPVVSYVSGPLSLRAAAEAIKYQGTATPATATPPNVYTAGKSETGFGFTGAYDIGGIKPILNFAVGKNAAGDKQNTVGVVVDTAFGATVGFIHGVTKQTGAADAKVDTVYGAYTLGLFGIQGASMTLAVAVSNSGGSNTAPDEKGGKVRINYTF
jgi:hypothetical protein